MKKLICTCYKHPDFNVFQMKDSPSKRAVSFEYNGQTQKIIKLKGDGDFRSDECLKYLKECDIVITNPPFSLFREFVIKLVEHNKQFLIIGNKNAITYKETFKLIKENKMWLGHLSPKKFEQAVGEPSNITKNLIGLTRWFTNLPVKYRNEEIPLWATYNEKIYPKYDNYDAINIDRVTAIPKDYFGAMGVPITFLDKYNPNQFEIIGQGQGNLFRELPGCPSGLKGQFVEQYYMSGQKGFIKNGHPVLGYYNERIPTIPYMRIIIKRKYNNGN